MPSYCEKDMKLVIDAEHRLLCFIAIYERQKAMGATPLFGVPYYPSKFASTSLILRAIITYRHKKQRFISNRMSSKEPIENKVSTPSDDTNVETWLCSEGMQAHRRVRSVENRPSYTLNRCECA